MVVASRAWSLMHGSILAVTPLLLPNFFFTLDVPFPIPGTGRMLKIPTPRPDGPHLSQGLAREGEMVTVKIEHALQEQLLFTVPFSILSKFTRIFNVHMELQPFSVSRA